MKNVDLFIVQKAINFLSKYKDLRIKYSRNLNRWHYLTKNKEKIIFELKNKFKMYLYMDSSLSKLIFEDFERMEEVFISKFLNKGDVFFDIGANVGFHTLNAGSILKNNGKIYAIEPTKRTYERLNENIILNNLTHTTKALQIGLSDTNGTLTLNVSDNGDDAYNSFANLQYIQSSDKQEVMVFTFEYIIEQENVPVEKIGLIKIDVEGWELNVLKGMDQLFSDTKFQPCFLIEFTEENMFRAGYSCREVYRFMENKGYSWYNYNPESNEITPAELRPYYPYENLIASKDVISLRARVNKT